MTVLETAEKWLPAGPRLVHALLAEDETPGARRVAARDCACPHDLTPRPEAVRP